MTNLEAPKSAGGNYTKLQPGENRLRIVSDIKAGWECWVDSNGNRKPLRQVEIYKGMELDILEVKDANGNPSRDQKQFYMAIVWNYTTEQFECMSQTQKAIKEGLYLLSKDTDWGDPKGYDIMINKSGEGLQTKYAVNPKPHSEFKDTIPPFNLDAMYEGGNPFETSSKETVDVKEDSPF